MSAHNLSVPTHKLRAELTTANETINRLNDEIAKWRKVSDDDDATFEKMDAELDDAHALISRQRDMLKRLEWAGRVGWGFAQCLVCSNTKAVDDEKHKPDCELRSLIDEGETP